MQNKSKIKQLIRNNCASYLGDRHGISNYCCLMETSCVYFNHDSSLPICHYFENGVLPTDERLEREYKVERNIDVERKSAKPRVKCKKCGSAFEANSNRQSFCEKCKKQNTNEKIKLRVRKLRQKEA